MTPGSRWTSDGRAARDRAAEVQHVDVVRDAHDEIHVVLDQHHGELQVVAQRADERRELVDLLVVEPARWLVEQDQPRLRDERAGELDALQRPERQAGGRAPRDVVDADVPRASRAPVCAPARALEAGDGVRADEHVLEHRHRREQLDVLEGARDPEA